MKGLSVQYAAEVVWQSVHPIDGWGISGPARFSTLSPDDFSLWMVEIVVSSDSELILPERHGDIGLHVRAGSVSVDGKTCVAGGTVIIESAATPTVGIAAGTELLHMGPTDPVVPSGGLNGPITAVGDDVHVVGPDGWLESISPGRRSRYYADSTCPGCRFTLLYTSRSVPYVSDTHSHSVDEIIYVVWGSITMGAFTLGPGDTLSVAADRRYGFRADGGFGFLNYRSDASCQTIERGSEPIIEGGLVNGFTPVAAGDLRAQSS